MLALVLVAVSVGLSNLAASVGIGAGGVDMATRIRVLAVYGLLEAAMPVAGLVLGRSLAVGIGAQARWVAAVLLAAVGGYAVFEAVRSGRAGVSDHAGVSDQAGHIRQPGPGSAGATGDRATGAAAAAGIGSAGTASGGKASPAAMAWSGRDWLRLLISGAALSLDNLVAGFAIGAYQVSLIAGALIFGFMSATMSLAGLEFGARIGRRIGSRAGILGGVILIVVGVVIGLGLLG